jgi:putative ABC transport system substrate-binding protein
MRRREFIVLVGTAAVAWPLPARAQQPTKIYRIAIVATSASIAEMSATGGNPVYSALFKELRQLGYVEGRNLVVERYSGEGLPQRYPELAGNVVRGQPDLAVC